MHHPLEKDFADNGMVAPGLSPSPMHQDVGYSIIPEGPASSSKANKAQYMPDETANSMAENDGQPGKENNGNFKDGHTHDFLKEPKTEMEGFIMRENDIDVIQEPVSEIDSLVKGAPDDFRDLQPLVSSNRDANITSNESFVPQKRKVQWNDDNGKELFQVLEYEARSFAFFAASYMTTTTLGITLPCRQQLMSSIPFVARGLWL